jgi:hypothetical protein
MTRHDGTMDRFAQSSIVLADQLRRFAPLRSASLLTFPVKTIKEATPTTNQQPIPTTK